MGGRNPTARFYNICPQQSLTKLFAALTAISWGVTRDHLVPTPSQAQHLVRHCGLAAVQGTQKYSPIAVSKSVCHNHLVAAILATSPSLFLYIISWCYSLA